MPVSTILASVRQPLATALASVSANVYNHVPESPMPPCVVFIPDSPYLEIETIGKSQIRVKINLTISAVVAYNSNPASLDNIEQLIMSILTVIPNGYIVGEVERPTVQNVGASTMLISDINVSTYYTQTI